MFVFCCFFPEYFVMFIFYYISYCDWTTPLQNEHVDVQLQEIKKLIIKCRNTRSHTELTVYKEEKNVNLYNVGGGGGKEAGSDGLDAEHQSVVLWFIKDGRRRREVMMNSTASVYLCCSTCLLLSQPPVCCWSSYYWFTWTAAARYCVLLLGSRRRRRNSRRRIHVLLGLLCQRGGERAALWSHWIISLLS